MRQHALGISTLGISTLCALWLGACTPLGDLDGSKDSGGSTDGTSGDGASDGSADGGAEGGEGAADGGGDGGTDGTDGADGGDGTAAWEPVTGHWTYTGGSLISDSCGADVGGGSSGAGFTLTVTGSGAFTLNLDGTTTGDHPCTWSEPDHSFACSVINDAQPIDDYDVTLVTGLVVNGSFGANNQMDSNYALNVQCSGGDCSWAELAGYSFPCDVNFNLTAAAD